MFYTSVLNINAFMSNHYRKMEYITCDLEITPFFKVKQLPAQPFLDSLPLAHDVLKIKALIIVSALKITLRKTMVYTFLEEKSNACTLTPNHRELLI